MPDEIKEPTLWELLDAKFCRPEYVLMREVRDKAGFSARRSADGIAMALWESRGLAIHGIEIKSHRNDWLRELKDPSKADVIFKYCDRWWVVAANETVVKESEVPATWGYMVKQKTRLKIIKDAPTLTPSVLDKGFVANMLRRAVTNMIHKNEIQKEIDAAVALAEINYKRDKDWKQKHLETEHESLQKNVKTFEEKSGIKITKWDVGDIAKQVNILLKLDNANFAEMLKREKGNYESMIGAIDKVLNNQQ